MTRLSDSNPSKRPKEDPQPYPPNWPDSHDPTGPPSTEELLGLADPNPSKRRCIYCTAEQVTIEPNAEGLHACSEGHVWRVTEGVNRPVGTDDDRARLDALATWLQDTFGRDYPTLRRPQWEGMAETALRLIDEARIAYLDAMSGVTASKGVNRPTDDSSVEALQAQIRSYIASMYWGRESSRQMTRDLDRLVALARIGAEGSKA